MPPLLRWPHSERMVDKTVDSGYHHHCGDCIKTIGNIRNILQHHRLLIAGCGINNDHQAWIEQTLLRLKLHNREIGRNLDSPLVFRTKHGILQRLGSHFAAYRARWTTAYHRLGRRLPGWRGTEARQRECKRHPVPRKPNHYIAHGKMLSISVISI